MEALGNSLQVQDVEAAGSGQQEQWLGTEGSLQEVQWLQAADTRQRMGRLETAGKAQWRTGATAAVGWMEAEAEVPSRRIRGREQGGGGPASLWEHRQGCSQCS